MSPQRKHDNVKYDTHINYAPRRDNWIRQRIDHISSCNVQRAGVLTMRTFTIVTVTLLIGVVGGYLACYTQIDQLVYQRVSAQLAHVGACVLR